MNTFLGFLKIVFQSLGKQGKKKKKQKNWGWWCDHPAVVVNVARANFSLWVQVSGSECTLAYTPSSDWQNQMWQLASVLTFFHHQKCAKIFTEDIQYQNLTLWKYVLSPPKDTRVPGWTIKFLLGLRWHHCRDCTVASFKKKRKRLQFTVPR